MPQDDSWWPETNGHDIGSQLVSRFEPIEVTQDDEQKDIEVGVEGKKFAMQHYIKKQKILISSFFSNL